MRREVLVGAGYNFGWEMALALASQGTDVTIIQAYERFYDELVQGRLWHHSLADRVACWMEVKGKQTGVITVVIDISYDSVAAAVQGAHRVYDFTECLFPGLPYVLPGPRRMWMSLIEALHHAKADGLVGGSLVHVQRHSTVALPPQVMLDEPNLCDQICEEGGCFPSGRIACVKHALDEVTDIQRRWTFRNADELLELVDGRSNGDGSGYTVRTEVAGGVPLDVTFSDEHLSLEVFYDRLLNPENTDA